MSYNTWQKIFNKLDQDVANRKGLQDKWQEVSPEVKMQICKEWWTIIKEVQDEEVMGQ